MHQLFPVRECEGGIAIESTKPCLNYHIKRCLGPCSGKVTKADYRKMIWAMMGLLNKRGDRLIKDAEREMNEAASQMLFEQAARLRDRISGIKEVIFNHQFQVNAVDNNNLIAICPSREADSAELFFIRKGELIGQKKVSRSRRSDDALLQMVATDIEEVFFSASMSGRGPTNHLDVDAMNIISRWLYRHRDDQSVVHVRRRRNKAETIASAAEKVERIIWNHLVPV